MINDVIASPVMRPGTGATAPDDAASPKVTHQTLAAWRAAIARLREEERKKSLHLSQETGRLLEIVGQALAQGGGSLPSSDISRIEAITHIDATYS